MPSLTEVDLAAETPRLSLRPLGAADRDDLRRITDHPEVTGAISFLPTPFTEADAAALIAQNDTPSERFLGVRRRTDGALVGVVGAHLQTGGQIEIGYWLARDCWGRGYAAEAAGALVAALRAAFERPRIIAECRPDNAASWRVLEKLGFRPTGEVEKRWSAVRGQEVDCIMYAHAA